MIVLAVAILGVGFRLFVAAETFGTYDMYHWRDFTAGAMRGGPLGIYDIDYQWSYYNHGPLTSWLLVGIGYLHQTGLSVNFLIRVVPSLADGVTTIVLFNLIRPVRGERSALTAAVVFALAPVTITIAGFHGNTDPVFVALALLAVWSLRSDDRGWPAGVAFGLAMSVKVVPVVMLPLLVVLAVRRGRPVLRRFLAGGGMVFLVLWVPVLVTHGRRFVSHVLLYPGVDVRQWGLSQAAVWAGVPQATANEVGDHVRFLVVAFAALAPALLARRRDDLALAGLPFCLLLAFSPAFSMQYLVWAVAPALIATSLRYSVQFVVAASVFSTVAYSAWSGQPPWAWDVSIYSVQAPGTLAFMVVVWFLLVRVCWWCAFPLRPDPEPQELRIAS
jgi:uncharacterized membrane protein